MPQLAQIDIGNLECGWLINSVYIFYDEHHPQPKRAKEIKSVPHTELNWPGKKMPNKYEYNFSISLSQGQQGLSKVSRGTHPPKICEN